HGQRLGGIDAPVIERAAGNRAFELAGVGGDEAADVVHRGEAAGGDDGDRDGLGKFKRRGPVDAGEDAVAVYIRVDDRGDAGALELLRKLDHAEFGGFRPALDGDLAALGVDADGDLAGEFLAGLDDQRRIAHGD